MLDALSAQTISSFNSMATFTMPAIRYCLMLSNVNPPMPVMNSPLWNSSKLLNGGLISNLVDNLREESVIILLRSWLVMKHCCSRGEARSMGATSMLKTAWSGAWSCSLVLDTFTVRQPQVSAEDAQPMLSFGVCVCVVVNEQNQNQLPIKAMFGLGFVFAHWPWLDSFNRIVIYYCSPVVIQSDDLSTSDSIEHRSICLANSHKYWLAIWLIVRWRGVAKHARGQGRVRMIDHRVRVTGSGWPSGRTGAVRWSMFNGIRLDTVHSSRASQSKAHKSRAHYWHCQSNCSWTQCLNWEKLNLKEFIYFATLEYSWQPYHCHANPNSLSHAFRSRWSFSQSILHCLSKWNGQQTLFSNVGMFAGTFPTVDSACSSLVVRSFRVVRVGD